MCQARRERRSKLNNRGHGRLIRRLLLQLMPQERTELWGSTDGFLILASLVVVHHVIEEIFAHPEFRINGGENPLRCVVVNSIDIIYNIKYA